MIQLKRLRFGAIGLLALLLVACGGQPDVRTVEVTRVVTETESVVEGEPVQVEVSRVVESVVEEEEDAYEDEAGDVDDVEGEITGGAPAPAAPLASPRAQEAPLQLPPTPEAPTNNDFEDYGVNPFIDTADDNLSTFAIDVDTGAYTVMRRYVTDSLLPPADSVRVEEYVNYFDQQYPIPQDGAFGINLEAAPAPYGESERYHLLRVGIQGYAVLAEERPDAMLIFVVDVSGSMDQENRLGLVRESLHMLVDNLRPTDQVGIVTYGSTADILLAPTYAVADRQIRAAIDGLRSGGSTNVEEGLILAYQLAAQFGNPGNINRLIIASDGVANVGNTTAETILQNAREGIQLSSFGFGMGNYNDVLMEQLANQGDGSYAYIDTLDEAERVFEDQLLSTILTIAKDAKIQVEFNPNVVERYRLIGYENRDVADADFRNDSVDAGEIGAGHSVTALYEVLFDEEANVNEAALTVRVRYEEPETAEIVEISESMAGRDVHGSLDEASLMFRFSAVVAEYAEIMGQSFWAQNSDIDQLADEARELASLMPFEEDVQEFAGLIAQAASLMR